MTSFVSFSRMRSAWKGMALACLALLCVGPARAQMLLYDPEPPAGSAYLRVVNGTSTAASVTVAGAGFTLGKAQADRIGTYRVIEDVQSRKITVSYHAGTLDDHIELSLTPGSFTTLLLLAGQHPAVVTDETRFNQIRAKVSFYNAAPECGNARLTQGADGPVIFEDVPAGAGRMRALNPVEAVVTPFCANAKGKALSLTGMEAGARYSIWFLMSPTPTAFMTRDNTQAWRR